MNDKFDVDGIPSLVVLSPSLEVIIPEGIEELEVAPQEALRSWFQGKRLFWSREPQQGEYVWENTICDGCYLSPLIGPRYGCRKEQCHLDFCENCLPNAKHEHPFTEFLIPKREYSLEKILETIPYLLQPNKEEKIQAKTILTNHLKYVGFYFSDHESSHCREFTSKLAQLYKERQTDCQSFDIIFISFDPDEDEDDDDNDDKDSFNKSRSEMPWLAAPIELDNYLDKYFQISSKNVFS